MKFLIPLLLLICSLGCETCEQTGYCEQPQRIITPQPQKEVVVKHEYDGPWPYYWKPYPPPPPAPTPPPTKSEVVIQVVPPATQPVVGNTTNTKNVIQVLPIEKVVIYTTTQPSEVPRTTESDAYKKLRLDQQRYWWER